MRLAIVLILISLLAGCLPGHLMVRESELHAVQQRLHDQEVRLAGLSEEQSAIQSTLVEIHGALLSRLQEIAATQGQQLQRQQEWEAFIRNRRLQGGQRGDELLEFQQVRLATVASEKEVIGAVERVFLAPPGVLLPARIDTGAATSSLDARDIERFERNGERWVRFTLVDPGDESELIMERKVVRNVRIIQAVAEEAERRPVVELGVTIGKTTQTAQFTLSDRRNLEYPVLIGRNILMDIMVVDVSESYLTLPRVPGEAEGDAGR